MLDIKIMQLYTRTAQHSTAQHSTAQHSTAQHSTAQHSTNYFFSLFLDKLPLYISLHIGINYRPAKNFFSQILRGDPFLYINFFLRGEDSYETQKERLIFWKVLPAEIYSRFKVNAHKTMLAGIIA